MDRHSRCGCNFINASAEFAQQRSPIYAFTAHQKAAIQRLIEQSLEAFAKRERKALAEQLALLVDGAIVRAHTHGERNATLLAKRMAAQLLARPWVSTSHSASISLVATPILPGPGSQHFQDIGTVTAGAGWVP